MEALGCLGKGGRGHRRHSRVDFSAGPGMEDQEEREHMLRELSRRFEKVCLQVG